MPIKGKNGVEIPVSAEVDDESFDEGGRQVAKMLSQQREMDAALNRSTDDRKKQVKELGKQLELQIRAEEQANKAREAQAARTSQQYVTMGRSMMMVGGVITGALVGAAAAWASKASAADDVARRWRKSMGSLEESSMQVGRQIANALNPALETAARLISQITAVIEKNPAIMQGVLAVGGGLVALGGLVTVIGAVDKTVRTLQLMQEAMTVAQATGGAGGAAANVAGTIAEFATIAAPIVIATLIAIGVIAIIGEAIKANEQNPRGTKGPVYLPGGMSQAQRDALRGAPAPGSAPATIYPNGPVDAGPRRRDFEAIQIEAEQNATILNLRKKWMEEVQKIEEDAAKKRLAATEDFEKKRADIEAQMAKAIADYLRNDAREQEDYYNRRADMAAKHGVEDEQAEREHRRRIQQIDEESANRLETLVGQRDALGVVQEKRAAEKARQTEEENYREQIRLRDANYAEQLAQMDREYAIARARRLEDFNLAQAARQAELDAAKSMYDQLLIVIQQAVDAARLLAWGPPPPAYANGTDYARGGLALVGERGPELVRLPQGAQVQTAEQTRAMRGNPYSAARDGTRAGAGSAVQMTINLPEGGTLKEMRRMLSENNNALIQTISQAFGGA
jgi:hypothetical protein